MDEIFSINISTRKIKVYNLENDYINIFDNLNKINSKYSSIKFIYSDNNDSNYLNKFKISFNKIKKIILENNYSDESKNVNNCDNFYKEFFSFNLNNLLFLKIGYSTIKIESNIFENINNMNLLEELQLNYIIFKNTFILKLNNLKILTLHSCKNIAFNEDSQYMIRILILEDCSLVKSNKLIKFPMLEKFLIEKNECYDSNEKYSYKKEYLSYDDIIDFSCDDIDFSNLKNINITIDKFINFQKLNIPLKYLNLDFDINYGINKKTYHKLFEKLKSFKTLEYINLPIININYTDISKIEDENIYVKNAEIEWYDDRDCILYYLQDKFPNLTNLKINVSDISQGFNQNSIFSLEIKENKNCKINKFLLDCFERNNIKFYIQSFENLIYVSLKFSPKYEIKKDFFPLFNDNCKIIFKSLTYFKLVSSCETFDFDILNNIHNNIDKIPNLEDFELKIYLNKFNKEFLKKFIKKILSLKLKNIKLLFTPSQYLTFSDNYDDDYRKYSIDELKKYCPNININDFEFLSIGKTIYDDEY